MRITTKDEIAEPFLAPLGELIYELIGSPLEVGGTTKHSFAHAVVPPSKLSPGIITKYQRKPITF